MTLHPPKFIIIFGLIAVAIELYLNLAKRSKSNAVSKDRNSLRLIWIVNVSAAALGVFAAIKLSAYQLPWPKLLVELGSGLIVLGLVLRWYSIIQLGRFFTTKVVIASDHKLVDSGPYHYIRHPSYTGSLLAVLGFTLCLQNWASLLVMFIPCCAVALWRIHIEEEALTGALGEQYRNYMHRTKRLIPLIY